MGDQDANKAFIPFNFSSVLPFDAISNALRELPRPQQVEPPGPFSQLPPPSASEPSDEVLAEMADLVRLTVQEEEWSRDAISDAFTTTSVDDAGPPWFKQHAQDVTSSLQRSFKRAPSSTPLLPPRPTPKRPRPRPSQEPSPADTRQPMGHDGSDSSRRVGHRHHPSHSTPSRQSGRTVHPEPSRTSPLGTSRRAQAPRGVTAPPRATTEAPSFSPNQRQTAGNLSHAQELRRHEDARDVESEDFDKFLNQLVAFSERPDALVSTTYDADEPPALLATGNLGVIYDLRQAITLVSPTGAMKHADPRILSKVISILQARVRYCAKQCHEANDSRSAQMSSRDASLGVMAVCTILDILAAPDSPRSLLVEELLDDIVLLLRAVMTLIVFPMCDPQFKQSKANSRRKRKPARSRRTAADEMTVPSDDDDRDEDMSPRAGRGKRAAILKKDEELLTHCRLFLNGLTSLVEKEKFLPDSVISQCLTVCVQSLSVIGIPRLQRNALKTICMVFSNYQSHRLSIMDDVRETASSVPETKRYLRAFQLAEGNISVRTSSALLGMLLCVSSHDIRESPIPKQVSALSPDAVKAWCKERETCHKRAVKFAVHVLKPLFTRACQDREQDFKLAFQTFFEDLLALFGRPEWPCAELLLQSLSVSIITKMRSGSEKSAIARGVAIDILGSLAARMTELYGKKLARHNVPAIQFKGVNESVEDARETILLFFQPQTTLHNASVEAFYEAMFVNDDYGMANMHDRRSQAIANQRNAIDKDEDEDVIDGQDGDEPDKETIIADLERRALKRVDNVRARRARGEEVSREDAAKATHFISLNRNFVGGFQTILHAILDGLQDNAPTIRAKAIKALSSMDEAHPGILRTFPKILKDVEPSCRDISTLVRDAALDLISRSLLAGLKSSNEVTASDSGNEQLSSSVFEVVRKRLSDSAVSVRKRAIGIMKAVLANSLSHCKAALQAPASATDVFKRAEFHKERIIVICTSLISRLEDPEVSVKEAAERTLRFGLFGFDISQSLPAKNDFIELAPQLAERLIGIFVRLSSNIHLTFISRVVHKAIMIKQGPLLHAIVNAAVEQYHGFEERVATIYNEVGSDDPSDEERAEISNLSSRRVACTSLISAFGSLDATLIENHCRSLAPSIKGVLDGAITENDMLTVQRILNVLEVGIGQSDSADPSFLTEILKDVEEIVSRSPFSILEEASVRCFCVVASKLRRSSESDDVVFNVADTFKKFLDSLLDEDLIELLSSPKPGKAESATRCALVRLGLLAKHGHLDDDSIDGIFETFQSVADLASQRDRRGIVSRALVRGLSHFLVKHRRFLRVGTERFVSMLESPIMTNGTNPASSDTMMSVSQDVPSAEHAVKLCVFQGFHELLRDEEERNTNKNPNEQPENGRHRNSDVPGSEGQPEPEEKSKVVVLAAEEDAEAGFLALSAQTMIPCLKKAVQSISVPIRRVVSNILGLLVRQGLLLPATIVPSLFTLSLDSDHHCRDYAFRVISFIADRHSGMLASAAVPALRVCFKTAFDLYPSSASRIRPGAAEMPPMDENKLSLPILTNVCVDPKTGQALLSPVIMAMRRDQRRGVLENLMKEFDPRVVVVSKTKENVSIDDEIPGPGGNEQVEEIRGDVEMSENARPGASADDDDVGEIGDGAIDLQGGKERCELAGLFFLAMTMANVDYTNGAGVGGSLSHGGGTSAADIKLKYAREEVNELVGTATRIISNSGQAVLRVARHICHGKGNRAAKRRIAVFAARVCVLLSLKYHLKVERWKGNEDEMRGLDEGTSAQLVRLPAFQPDCELIEMVGWGNSTTEISEEVADRQIDRLVRMMREDAIDEADLTVPSRRGARNTGRKGGRSSAKRRKAVDEDGVMNTPAQVQRRRASKRASATKQLTYDDGSDDGGSDYDPRG